MKLKKLRRIYRVLFPLKLSFQELFENNLKSNTLIREFNKVEDLYSLKLNNNTLLYLRDQNHSDYSVFNQIFNNEEYKTVASILKYNDQFETKENILIDAGANVGYATVYLQQILNFHKVICIEPSSSNFEILKKNIGLLNCAKDILLFENALASKKNLNFNIENDFRDRKDWSIRTKEDKSGNIKGITINEIIDNNNLSEITLLKIDIEGSERFIFEESADLSFLHVTKIIVIEIHDEFDIRKGIYRTLINNNFLIMESGELTIAINKKFL
ncbi:MAG: FkbM family methyltransferase [Bacteroidota bacterium]